MLILKKDLRLYYGAEALFLSIERAIFLSLILLFASLAMLARAPEINDVSHWVFFETHQSTQLLKRRPGFLVLRQERFLFFLSSSVFL